MRRAHTGKERQRLFTVRSMAVELGDAVKWRLWPPSDGTRATLVERMATNLASVSFFSQKYGRIEASEADKHAKRIEEAAFVAAQKEADNGVEGIGTGIVQFYAKHASHLMLQTLRSKKPSVVPDVAEGQITLPSSKFCSFSNSFCSCCLLRLWCMRRYIHVEDVTDFVLGFDSKLLLQSVVVVAASVLGLDSKLFCYKEL